MEKKGKSERSKVKKGRSANVSLAYDSINFIFVRNYELAETPHQYERSVFTNTH